MCPLAMGYSSNGGAASSGFTARMWSDGSRWQSAFWGHGGDRFQSRSLWVHCKCGGDAVFAASVIACHMVCFPEMSPDCFEWQGFVFVGFGWTSI
ncbi:unnamed protein product [Eruca vesicaria subsp. sativa]|uniref:Uncharacterized protein n=1 Tax=Eruca vesicaria subsp. sativa TaxID=29727 RepID=A0ABC8IZ68_ERUVS|nr:unnamed protein product [Eruca vesicaria subsp. sativa]